MPNRDGEDTGDDDKRRPWHPSQGGGAVAGSQRASTPSGLVHVDPSPYGWTASHSREGLEHIPGSVLRRGEVFEDTINHYGAGPFRTEHRAKRAALSLAERDEEKLTGYRA